MLQIISGIQTSNIHANASIDSIIVSNAYFQDCECLNNGGALTCRQLKFVSVNYTSTVGCHAGSIGGSFYIQSEELNCSYLCGVQCDSVQASFLAAISGLGRCEQCVGVLCHSLSTGTFLLCKDDYQQRNINCSKCSAKEEGAALVLMISKRSISDIFLANNTGDGMILIVSVQSTTSECFFSRSFIQFNNAKKHLIFSHYADISINDSCIFKNTPDIKIFESTNSMGQIEFFNCSFNSYDKPQLYYQTEDCANPYTGNPTLINEFFAYHPNRPQVQVAPKYIIESLVIFILLFTVVLLGYLCFKGRQSRPPGEAKIFEIPKGTPHALSAVELP